MNEEYIDKLYGALTEQKWVTVSKDEFAKALQDSAYVNKLHGALTEQKWVTVDVNEFSNSLGTLKKKEQAQPSANVPIGSTTPSANWRMAGGNTQPPSQRGTQQQSLAEQGTNVLRGANQQTAQRQADEAGIVPIEQQPQQAPQTQPTAERENIARVNKAIQIGVDVDGAYGAAVDGFVEENKDFISQGVKNVQEALSSIGENKAEADKSFAEEQIPFAEDVELKREAPTVSAVERKSKSQANTQAEINERFRSNILNQIPEDKRQDEAYLSEIEQSIFDNQGMVVDLTGDGKVGDRNMAVSAANSFLKGLDRLGYNLEYYNPVSLFTDRKSKQAVVEANRQRAMDGWDKRITQYEKGLGESIESGDVSNAFGQTLNMIGDSGPTMIAAAAMSSINPYLGYATMSTLSAGDTYLSVKNEDWFKELTPEGQFAYVAAVGGAEGAGEMLGGKVLTRVFKDAIKDITSKAGTETVKGFLKGYAKGLGLNLKDEMIGEMLPSVTEYVATTLAQGGEVTPNGLWGAAKEGMYAGAAMAGTMTTAGKAASVPFVAANQIMIKSYGKKLDDLRTSYANAKTPTERQIIADEIVSVSRKRDADVNASFKVYDSMDEADKKRTAEISAQLEVGLQNLEEIDQNSDAYQIQKRNLDALQTELFTIEQKYSNTATDGGQAGSQVGGQVNDVVSDGVKTDAVGEKQTEKAVDGENVVGESAIAKDYDELEGKNISELKQIARGGTSREGFYAYSLGEAERYSDLGEGNEKLPVQIGKIKNDANILYLVSGEYDNPSISDEGIAKLTDILGKNEVAKMASEGAFQDDPSEITSSLWGEPKRISKLKKAGIDIVIGNTIDGVSPVVLNENSVEYNDKSQVSDTKNLTPDVQPQTTTGESSQTKPDKGVSAEKSPVNYVKNLTKVSTKTDKTDKKVSLKPDKTPSQKSEEKGTSEPTATEEKAAEKVGITPKSLRDLYAINRDMFGQNKVKAFASAVIMDKMIGAMAIMKGVSKAKIYATLEFRKGAQTMPDGVKFQVDAWHGSPYQFDKFELSKIGSGEGHQAFGWGLYFTELKSIAERYADVLGGGFVPGVIYKGKKVSEYSKEIQDVKGGVVLYEILSIHGSKNEYKNAKDALEETLKIKKETGNGWPISSIEAAIELLKSGDFTATSDKNVYKVSLHKGKTPEQYTWLEWDKPVDRKLINLIRSKLTEEQYKEGFFDTVKSLGISQERYIKSGESLYDALTVAFNSNKKASLFLLENGIDGIKYPAESVSRGATSDNARGFNYVVFDENAVSIEEVIKFQKDAIKARGAMMMALDGKAIIYALTDPNVSTPLHELAHVFEHYLTETQKASVLKWTGATEWSVEVSEKFARGFEKYLADGKAPTANLQKIFDRFKEWLTDIYNGITGSEIDIELNDEMKALYGKMFGEKAAEKKTVDENVKEAEKNLKSAWENRKKEHGAIEIIFDPKSKAAADVQLMSALVNYVRANGLKTIQQVKDAIITLTNGALELTREGAQGVLDGAYPSYAHMRSRILGFATGRIKEAINAKEGIESHMTNAQLLAKEHAQKVDKDRAAAEKTYAKKNNVDSKTARADVSQIMNNLLLPKENNTTSAAAYAELSKVSKPLADSVMAMRTHIDELSTKLLSLPSFARLPAALRNQIQNNIGEYIHREYLFFKKKPKNKGLKKIDEVLQLPIELSKVGFWNPSLKMIDDAARAYAQENNETYDDAYDAILKLIDDWNAERDPLVFEQAGVISTANMKLRSDALKRRVKIAQDQNLWFDSLNKAEAANPKANKGVIRAKAAEIYEQNGGVWNELPNYIRTLLGEVKDPVSRYVNTMMAMQSTIQKANAMQRLLDAYGGGFFWIQKEEPSKDKADFVMVDDALSPLNGMWVHKHLINEFNQKAIYQTDYAVVNALFTIQNWFRQTKIFPNPATWFKNVIGGFYGQVLNGQFYGLTDPKSSVKSLYGRLTEMTAGKRTEFMKVVYDEAARAGVLSSSVDIAVMGYLDDMFIAIENRDYSMFEKASARVMEKGINRVRLAIQETRRRYAQVDDHSKAIMVYEMKNDHANMMFGTDYANLTKEKQDEVLYETGNIVKRTMPTFSRLPSWFRAVSRVPFFGDFLSFKVEAMRSFTGAIRTAFEHGQMALNLKGDLTPAQQIAYAKSSAKRLAGISAISALNYTMITYATSLFSSVFSGEDDEEETLEKQTLRVNALQNAPNWTAGKTLVLRKIDKFGNVYFFDYSGQDPYADVIALATGNTESLSDIFTPSLTLQTLSEAYNGEDDWGLIYFNEDSWYEKMAKGGLHISQEMIPPLIGSAYYEYNSKKKDQADFGSFEKKGMLNAAGDYASIVAPRMTVRDYKYNIYTSVSSMVYDKTSDKSVPQISKAKSEDQVYKRIVNLKQIRTAHRLALQHMAAYPNEFPKVKYGGIISGVTNSLRFNTEEQEFILGNDEESQKILDGWLSDPMRLSEKESAKSGIKDIEKEKMTLDSQKDAGRITEADYNREKQKLKAKLKAKKAQIKKLIGEK